MGLLLGLDIGTSTVKALLLDSDRGSWVVSRRTIPFMLLIPAGRSRNRKICGRPRCKLSGVL